ncbi:hypothetical protein JTB14_010825 [Gonioctena quinquepunctata]|nr:hypothetical protein JTB14_010825 [Gonioctena quinquepunctata]
MDKGTKPTMKLTSSPSKDELEAMESINNRKKPVLDMKNPNERNEENYERKKIDETCENNEKTKDKESWLTA